MSKPRGYRDGDSDLKRRRQRGKDRLHNALKHTKRISSTDIYESPEDLRRHREAWTRIFSKCPRCKSKDIERDFSDKPVSCKCGWIKVYSFEEKVIREKFIKDFYNEKIVYIYYNFKNFAQELSNWFTNTYNFKLFTKENKDKCSKEEYKYILLCDYFNMDYKDYDGILEKCIGFIDYSYYKKNKLL